MTNSKATKKALFTSMISLLLCFTMLMGATFAWFTDTVKSTNNIIKSGTLDVTLEWAKGTEAVPGIDSENWLDASKDAIFKYDLWEPGYTEVRHIKIENEGTLALKYELRIIPTGVVSKLADVIDVYFIDPAKQVEGRTDLDESTRVGTLKEVIAKMPENTSGELLADDGETQNHVDTVTIALKMQESAGNEYQNLAIGSDFTVQLIATQLEAEIDSFGSDYDKEALQPTQDKPAAMVTELTGDELNISASAGIGGTVADMTLAAGYKFEPTETYEQAKESPYRYYHADFVVSADSTVPANSLALAGYYHEWCQYNGNNWVALASDVDITEGQEVRLVESMGGGSITVNYEDICNFGNDGIGFQCGIVDLSDGANDGTTVTVELRLYETKSKEESTNNSVNEEVGPENYITVGTFTHTFGEEYERLSDGTTLCHADNGEVVLYNTADVTATTYTVPEGVTTIGGLSFAGNDNIEKIILPSTVKTLDYKAFRETSASEIELNEGLITIGEQAFRKAANLKSIKIPSTVTTISNSAFQESGIETLTIPETVTTIEYGACRDMDYLTTVTIEGDHVDIPGYAFRDCKSLKTVYLKANSVTLGNAMIFTNDESNNANPNNITIYVYNDDVYNTLVADTNVKGTIVKVTE